MEVRCSNCATEYEFDDALVSARGTSVKCTNCGHQFRVHPTTASPTVAEQWVVRDAQKRETTFTSLRDLQQAIVKGQLSPQHQLSHGGQSFRPLEDIYELQTFFNASRQRPARPAPRTLLGVGRDGQPLRPTAPPPRKRPSEVPQERVTPVSNMPAMHAATALEASRPDLSRSDLPRADAQRLEQLRLEQQRTEPSRLEPARDPWSLDSVARTATAQRPPPGSSLPPPAPERNSMFVTAPPATAAPVPWQNLHGLHADGDAEVLHRKGAGSRWIVAIVVLGGLALVGGTVGRQYLLGVSQPKVVVPKVDERVPALLEQARAALAKGDFEGAHAELAKASVLVEGDPRVASELGRVEVARVELLWAQQRLHAALDAAKAEAAAHAPQRRRKTEAEQAAEALAANQDANEKKLLEQSFQERLGKAKAAVAEAVRLAPTSIDVVRSQVDLLRLSGELPRARTMVSALSAQATDPDNAYSLGALDLAEGPAGYPSAIERLRVAARGEEALGRARPLLIYALTQTDPAAASAELDKLQTVAPTHRSLPALRTLVEFASAKQAAAEPEPAPRRPASTALASSPKPPASADPVKGTLAKANDAFAQGDLDSAESLYRTTLQRSPGNIAALSGLGDIARQRQQNATAAAYYDQILKQDRNHLPTLMSRGDMYWESGNRILAVALYRRAITQVGSDDSRVARAWQRIEEFEREVGSVPKAAEPAPSTAPAPSEPAPSTAPAPSERAPSEPAPSEPAPSEPAPSGLGPSDEAPAAESPAGKPASPAPPKSGTPVPEPPSDPSPNPSGRQPPPSGDVAPTPGAPAATP